MRTVVTLPVIELALLQGDMQPAFTPGFRDLMIAGLAKPIITWKPAGPNSWKYAGSPDLMNASCGFVPSRVLVCNHSSPRAIRSAPGVAITSYSPGYRFTMSACPASRESVVPSDSYFRHFTILPT